MTLASLCDLGDRACEERKGIECDRNSEKSTVLFRDKYVGLSTAGNNYSTFCGYIRKSFRVHWPFVS